LKHQEILPAEWIERNIATHDSERFITPVPCTGAFIKAGREKSSNLRQFKDKILFLCFVPGLLHSFVHVLGTELSWACKETFLVFRILSWFPKETVEVATWPS
jgi:hypothetical protein